MLYILGGASRSGKSIIAHRLLKEKQISFFSTDFLMMGFHKGMPDFGVNEEDPCYEVAEKLWPILKGMMDTLIGIKQDYVIEGDALLPRHIRELIDEKGEDQIRACFVGYAEADAQQKVQNVREFSTPNDWTKDKSDDFVLSSMRNQIEYSKKLKEECDKFRIKYFDTSNNFNEAMSQIFNFMMSM